MKGEKERFKKRNKKKKKKKGRKSRGVTRFLLFSSSILLAFSFLFGDFGNGCFLPFGIVITARPFLYIDDETDLVAYRLADGAGYREWHGSSYMVLVFCLLFSSFCFNAFISFFIFCFLSFQRTVVVACILSYFCSMLFLPPGPENADADRSSFSRERYQKKGGKKKIWPSVCLSLCVHCSFALRC